ncbi:AsmA-like C-terminal region-containing protein [Aquabacter sp. P-9]|uniref:AsmA-like C-terminal region-containing protein n=1 Tax=Aquabacter sediminis TaxID=3029197 RepID=UPI00237D4624|nr:AsmA-like C-terminal region-containing protein [Aquabacter sp. P-9]MDE1570870.1 AsmA-like C-terminal region-containing protein [Aquabacter sp. P-9]
MVRWALRAVLALGVLAGLVVGTFLLLARLPSAEPLRRTLVERGLTQIWGQPVEVKGAVSVTFRPRLAVHARQVVSSTVGEEAEIGELVLALAPYADLRPDSPFFGFALSDARFNILIHQHLNPAPGSILSSPVQLLRHLPHLKLDRVAVDFNDPELGWRFLVELDRLRTSPEGGREKGEAKGRLNGRPLDLSFIFDRETERPEFEADSARPYGAKILFGSQGLTGSLMVRAPNLEFEGDMVGSLTARTTSLDDLLALARIAPIGGGSGHMSAELGIEAHALSVPKLNVDFTLPDGARVTLHGKVDDALHGKGISINAVADIDPDAPPAVSIRDITVTRLSGHFLNARRGLMLNDIHIGTNAFAENLREIGPIQVARVQRGPDGEVALRGISVVAGPEDKPIFRLTGSIGDVLDFSQVELAGSIDMAVSDVLLLSGGKPEDLGRLVGNIAISDADGTLGINAFTAELQGTDLVRAKLALRLDDLPGEKGPQPTQFHADIQVPRLGQLARALGFSSDFDGPASFLGDLAGTSDSLKADGQVELGRTRIDGALTSEARGERSFISGHIHSPTLYVNELREVFRRDDDSPPVPRISIVGASAPAGGSQLDLIASTDADVRVSADRLDGSVEGASGIEARVRLEKGVLRGDPVRVRYGGGVIEAVVSSEGEQVLRAKGNGQGWPLASLMRGGKGGVSASGTVRLDFDLTAKLGVDTDPLRTLDGTATARVRNGRLGTGMLDLAGLGVLGGLFNPNVMKGESPLRCVKVPLSFSNGVGKTDPVIVIETDAVQALGRGTINLVRNTVDLYMVPRPLNALGGAAGYSFTVKGNLDSPTIGMASGGGTGLKGNYRCE